MRHLQPTDLGERIEVGVERGECVIDAVRRGRHGRPRGGIAGFQRGRKEPLVELGAVQRDAVTEVSQGVEVALWSAVRYLLDQAWALPADHGHFDKFTPVDVADMVKC